MSRPRLRRPLLTINPNLFFVLDAEVETPSAGFTPVFSGGSHRRWAEVIIKEKFQCIDC
jgi:hypothetical protein